MHSCRVGGLPSTPLHFAQSAPLFVWFHPTGVNFCSSGHRHSFGEVQKRIEASLDHCFVLCTKRPIPDDLFTKFVAMASRCGGRSTVGSRSQRSVVSKDSLPEAGVELVKVSRAFILSLSLFEQFRRFPLTKGVRTFRITHLTRAHYALATLRTL